MWLVILASLIASGCTSLPIPKYAKKGDLVTVPLGGSKTFANSNYLTLSDVAVTVTDNLGQVFPASVIRMYRVYADPSSRYAAESRNANSTISSVIYANEGQWMMQFLMPITNSFGQTPEPGIANIAVVSTEQNPDPDPKKRRINTDRLPDNPDMGDLKIEILAGSGGAFTFDYFVGGYLATVATIVATPSDESVLANNVGGAVFVYEYTTASFNADGIPYAAKTSPDQNIQFMTRSEDIGGSVTRLTVIVINPKGFYDDASWVPGMGTSYYDGLQTVLSWDNNVSGTVTDANWTSHISLVTAESYYIDLDGNPIPNVSTVLTKVR